MLDIFIFRCILYFKFSVFLDCQFLLTNYHCLRAVAQIAWAHAQVVGMSCASLSLNRDLPSKIDIYHSVNKWPRITCGVRHIDLRFRSVSKD